MTTRETDVPWRVQYNTKGKPFALRDTAGRSQVIVPKEMVRWLVGQPNGVFSQRLVLKTKFAIKYFSPPPPKVIPQAVIQVVRHDLTRNLGRLQPLIYDILHCHFDNILGMEENEWKEVDLAHVIEPAFAGVFHRVLLGEVLCQQTKSLKSFKQFSLALGLAALGIGQFLPFFMAPPIGYLSSWLVAFCRRRALARLTPVAQERLDNIKRAKMDPTFGYEAQMDIIQWLAVATRGEATATEVSDAVLSLVSFPALFFLPLSKTNMLISLLP